MDENDGRRVAAAAVVGQAASAASRQRGAAGQHARQLDAAGTAGQVTVVVIVVFVHAVRREQQQRRCGRRADGGGRGQFRRDVQRVAGRPRAHVRRQDHQMFLRLRGVRGEISAGPDQDPGGNNERMPVSSAQIYVFIF